MKKTFILSSLAVLSMLSALPGGAAQRVKDYEAAQALVTDDGYIIFAYADGWDKFSKKLCEELLADEAILKAAGSAALLPVGIPEQPNDIRQQELKKLCGKLNLPGVHSYPALIFYDKQHRHYATLSGEDVSRTEADELARLITARMQACKERLRLLEESDKAQGPQKAALLMKAYRINGLTGADKKTLQNIRKLDGKDTTGIIRSLNFNPYGFATELDKKGVKKGIELVNNMLKDDAYTDRQKQQICAAAIGMLRRKAGSAGAKAMRQFTLQMNGFEPNSAEGKTAPYILEHWIKYMTYEEGWTPQTLPADKTPIELGGEIPIRSAGQYSVRFNYKKGNQALVVLAVELYDGDKKVAEDKHKCSAGNRNSGNVYILNVPSAVAKPRLLITFDMPNRDSYGTIGIRKM